jgi:excinuclease ABC subunit B
VAKGISDILTLVGRGSQGAPVPGSDKRNRKRDKSDFANLPKEEIGRLIRALTAEMNEASADLRFEYAAKLRDEIHDLQRELKEVTA